MKKSYSVRPARYAKGKMVVSKIESDGWKSRFDRLVEALGGKWVHRDGGYQLSPKKLAKFEQLFADGWDGSFFGDRLIAPKNICGKAVSMI